MTANAFATTTSQIDFTDRGDIRDQIDVEGGYQSLLERDVVVRRLRPSAAASPRTRGRFIKEMQTLATLHHHNFVRVYDAGVSDEIPFAVLERLQGVTAQHRIDLLANRGTRMEIDEAVRIVRGAADAVEYARRRGARVYDLTPGNIMLTEDRRVVLTALGQPLPDNPLTASATVLAYTPPERLFGEIGESEGEVYSLGVLLAHLLYGRLPFEGGAIEIIARKQQSDTLPLLEDPHLSHACPYPLATVIHRATTYEAADRYPGVEQFRAALLDAVGRQGARSQTIQFRGQRAGARASEEVYTHAFGEEPLYTRAAADRPQARAVGEELRERAVGEELHLVRPAPRRQSFVAPVPLAVAYEEAEETEERQERLVLTLPPLAGEPGAPDEPVAYDPLMPGLNTPELHAALAYTVLVPLPGEEEQAALPAAAPRQGGLPAHYLLILMTLGFLAITTAVMFG
jgi:hypothetical protein